MDLKKKLGRLSMGAKSATGVATSTVPAPAPGDTLPSAGRIEQGALPFLEPPRSSGASDPRLEAIRSRLKELEQRKPKNEVRAPSGGGIPFVETRETPMGVLHVKDTRFAPEHRHGRVALSHAHGLDPQVVATLSLDPAMAELDFTRMVLLDTETTGLAGGTGTLPFLIGTAQFEGRAFHVEQLFLRRPGEEAPMLRALAERLSSASCLVTYNGKSFDWPLLRNRFVMNRLKVPEPPPHLDLLHCARRVFRRRGSGGKLTHLEQTVLGYTRVGDVPGEEIPERYFAFIRRGLARPMVPVLEHNVLDLVALAALFGELVRQFQLRGAEGDLRDQLGFAEVAARANDLEAADAFARSVSAAGKGAEVADALSLRAVLARKRGDSNAAVAALTEALRHAAVGDRSGIHLSLAKLYEHRLRDPARALEHARHTALAEGREANLRRVKRLADRIAECPPSEGQLELAGRS